MSEMKLTNLTVDLLQEQASVNLVRQGTSPTPEKPQFTALNINVPIETPGNKPENQLKKIAIEQAVQALEEALATLKAYKP